MVKQQTHREINQREDSRTSFFSNIANSFWTKLQKRLNEESIVLSEYVWEELNVHLKESLIPYPKTH